MIITGYKTREAIYSAGSFCCPNCRTPQPFHQLAVRRWFTLYFIPLFPIGSASDQVECQGCLGRFSADVLTGGASAEPLEATIVEEGAPVVVPPPIVGRRELPPQTSGLAILSLILGMVSPVFLCACGLSFLTSLGAIVSGHVALARINRSGGKLVGYGTAVAGLVAGYLFLVVSVASYAFIFPAFKEGWNKAQQEAARGPRRPNTADERLREAEVRVLTDSTEGVASGNSDEARQLAREYAEGLKQVRDEMFTKDRDRGFSLTRGQFIVHCERHSGRCAFLVHVPSFRDFTTDAKQSLARLAWDLAQQQLAGKVPVGDRLAIGLRGTILYGAVMTGDVGGEFVFNGADERPDRTLLLPFFLAAEQEPLTSEAEP